MKDRGGISQKREDEKHSPDIASIRRLLLAFHSKRPVAAAVVVLKVKHLIHVAPKLLSFYEWLKSIFVFLHFVQRCIFDMVECPKTLGGPRGANTAMLPSPFPLI